MGERLRRQIPSPAALFTFEAAARLGNFRDAALELNVTQPSVSYQIRQLETHIGAKLFERHARGVTLTASGETLFNAVARGFEGMQAALATISRVTHGNLVTLCASSSAAAHFMVPRFPRLRAELPELDLSLKIDFRDMDPIAESADFAIRLGEGNWEGMQCWRLFDEVYYPLCAPGFFTGPASLEQLKATDLLFLKERYRARDDWRNFFEKMGSSLGPVAERLSFSDQQPLLDAAIAGQGVGLGWLGLTDHFLENGSLIKPTALEVRTGRGFYLIAPQDMDLLPMAAKFRDWMTAEGKEIQARWEAGRIS